MKSKITVQILCKFCANIPTLKTKKINGKRKSNT